jgi:O-antigen/teichoic acid export membrane protein
LNRTEKFVSNSFIALLLQLVTFAAGLIGPRLILKTYGSEINGLVSSINQFIVYFNLVEAGLASTSIYALFKPLADRAYNEINGVLSATKKYYEMSGYVFVTLTLGMAIIYPNITQSSSLSPFSVGLLVIILGTSGALQFFVMAKYRALLMADQKQYILSVASILSIVLNTSIIAIGCYLKLNIVLLRAICLLSVFSPIFIMYVYVSKHYKYIDYSVKPNNLALRNRWTVLSNEIFGTINAGAPLIILTFCTTLIDVSIYTTYDIVIKGIGGLCGFFVLALSASLGELIALGDQDKFEKTYNEFEHIFYAFIMWLYGCTMILMLPFVEIFTAGVKDAEYYLPMLAILFITNALLSQFYSPQAILVRAGGKFKEVRKQTIIQAMITVVFGVILTLVLGIIGVLLASIMANIYRVIKIIKTVQKSMLPASLNKTWKRILFLNIGILLICLPFKIGIKPGIVGGTGNFLNWILYAIGVSIYALIVTFVLNFYIDRKVSKSLAKRVLFLIRKLFQ